MNIEIFIITNVIVFFVGMWIGLMLPFVTKRNYKVQDANPPKPKEWK